jgi:hypothetical protein
MATVSALSYAEQPENVVASREQLILDHLPQVNWIATRIHEKLSGNTNLEDLISTGIIGLINAIDNFDPAFNVKLKIVPITKTAGPDSVLAADGIARRKTPAIEAGPNGIGAGAALHASFEEETPRNWESSSRVSGVAGRVTRDQHWKSDAGKRTIRSLISYVADCEDNPARILERPSFRN